MHVFVWHKDHHWVTWLNDAGNPVNAFIKNPLGSDPKWTELPRSAPYDDGTGRTVHADFLGIGSQDKGKETKGKLRIWNEDPKRAGTKAPEHASPAQIEAARTAAKVPGSTKTFDLVAYGGPHRP